MKIKISTSLKWSVVGVWAIVVLLCCGLWIYETQTVRTEMKEKIIYTYQTEASAPYEVYVKSNILYSKEKLEAHMNYLSAFVSNIKIHFKHIFKGEVAQDLTGHYTVKARLQGYVMEEENKKVIWSKEEVVIPEKQVKAYTDLQTITEEVNVDFEKYNDYVKQVLEDSKAATSVEVVVELVGEINTTINGQAVQVPVQIGTIIPLQMSYFAMTQEGIGENKGDVKVNETHTLPPRRSFIGAAIGGGVTGLLGILYFIFLTEAPTDEEVYIKKIQRLLKEHGSRMVGIHQISESDFERFYELYTIEDLIKIADELEKPVYYIHNRDIRQINQFYVESQNIIYCYKINSAIKKLKNAQEEQVSKTQ